MPEAIEFPSYDRRFTLRGRIYRPDGVTGPIPAVVASGGFADSVERMVTTAEALAAAGLGVLIYEHRNTGISDGEPRGEIDPITQTRDMAMAVTFARTVEGFDPDRLGLFGTSFSGGHVLALAAADKRIKAVVASNPWIAGFEVALHLGGAQVIEQFRAILDQERERALAGAAPTLVTLGRREDDPSTDFALFRDNAAMDYFEHSPAGRPETWRNEFTQASLEFVIGYDVRQYAKRISPTPLMMLVALDDHTMPAHLGLQFFEDALEPKELVTFRGGHYDAYMPEGSFGTVMAATARWFRSHLSTRGETLSE